MAASKKDVSPARAAETHGFAQVEALEDGPQKVRALLDEITALRERLETARQEISALKISQQHDGDLPVLKREAFQHALGVGVEGARGYLARVRVRNLPQIIARYGDEIADEVLRHMARLLADHVRDMDTVGRVGTASFGVVLAYADAQGAQVKMDDLVAKTKAAPFIYQGTMIEIELEHTIAPLTPTKA